MSSTTSAPGVSNRGRLVLGGLGLAVIMRLWIVPLGSSLWLDEFGTWWVSNGRFGEILERARLFPQSVLYAAIVWVARAIGGSSEIALRMPSLLAAGLAAGCLYRLGNDLFDRETGLLAAAIFIADPEICFAAGDARPYAFAVLASIAALWMLARWLEGGPPWEAAAYVICACAAVYFQYLFGTMLVVHAAYALRKWRQGAVPVRSLAAAAAAIAILTAPATVMAAASSRNAALHSFGAMPGVLALLKALFATGVVAALLGSLLVCWILGWLLRRPAVSTGSPPVSEPPPGLVPTGDALWLLALSAVIPAGVLFGASHGTGIPVFVARYMLCMIPAQALLLAWLVRGIRPPGGQRAVVAGYLLIMLVARGSRTAHTGEDWRGAVAALAGAGGNHPVLLSGTYTESRNVAWVGDDAHAAYMRAPLDFYAAVGRPSILPLRASPDAEAYVGAVVSGLEDRFAMIERESRFPSWTRWLESRLRPRGYRMRRVWVGNPSVWVFERDSPGESRQ